MNIAICDRPVFVLGAPRSGTSMMQWALRQHPNLWGGEESDYLVPLVKALREVWELGRSRGRRHWLSEHSVEWEEFIRYMGIGVNALCSDRASGKRWIEQTPQYTRHIDTMSLLFPGAQFVVMVRDGRQVVESLMRFVIPMDFERACRVWAGFNEAAQEFSKGPLGPSMLFVSYEEVIRETQRQIAAVFEFLGESFSQNAVDHIVDKAPINSSFEGESGRAKLAARWRSWPVERREAFHQLAGDMLVELGYEPDTSWISDAPERGAA